MCMKDGAPKKPAKGPCQETHSGWGYSSTGGMTRYYIYSGSTNNSTATDSGNNWVSNSTTSTYTLR